MGGKKENSHIFHSKIELFAKSLEIVRQAKAGARELTTLAEAVRDAFLTRRRARISLNPEEESRLFEEAIAWMDCGVDWAIVWQEYEANRTAAIARRRAVADFRVFWDALGAALKDRDKILIDAEKISGQRQLLLFDPKEAGLPILSGPRSPKNSENEP